MLLVPLLLLGLVVLALGLVRLVGRPWLSRTILEADNLSGKAFDALLMLAIALSVLAVVLESDPLLRQHWAGSFLRLEWGFTLLFSLEYLLRLLLVAEPRRYATSFYGIVDLLAILPSYLGLLIGGGQLFLVVRVLRLLRVFRVLKLGAYLQEAELLWSALIAARRKITVFLLAMVTLVILIGAFMYVIEAGNDGFGSIPVAIYWACVTITTVGYGDVAPVTPLGRFMASVVMLIGYSIIAVPTGILSAEIGLKVLRPAETSSPSAEAFSSPPDGNRTEAVVCGDCRKSGHDPDARHCKFCGAELK
ncbi:potassium channel family protein [Cyanobium sp. AMD-g]|uniref:potassium channel family protein n=1 Tax=Cyanobium sp. AMD-g TaxID=2823699 RepID=UPI0020CBC6B0|nr:ion transporter [Cyanobium sp. AMD-g]MCP9931960.1 potassium channel family protein [Cyanobium sp. AMD-g]